MAEQIEYSYRRNKVKVYMTTIIDMPDIFGRVIVALVDYIDFLKGNKNLRSSDLTHICEYVYSRKQTKKRIDYLRVFVREKRRFLTNFIERNAVMKKTTRQYKFQSFEEIGKAARIDIDDFNGESDGENGNANRANGQAGNDAREDAGDIGGIDAGEERQENVKEDKKKEEPVGAQRKRQRRHQLDVLLHEAKHYKYISVYSNN